MALTISKAVHIHMTEVVYVEGNRPSKVEVRIRLFKEGVTIRDETVEEFSNPYTHEFLEVTDLTASYSVRVDAPPDFASREVDPEPEPTA